MGAQEVLASRLSYAQCWEDPNLLREALNVTKGGRVLSIASGGCNSLDLALAGAHEVVAVDLSLPQLAVTELKMAGMRASERAAWMESLVGSVYHTLTQGQHLPSQAFGVKSKTTAEQFLAVLLAVSARLSAMGVPMPALH